MHHVDPLTQSRSLFTLETYTHPHETIVNRATYRLIPLPTHSIPTSLLPPSTPFSYTSLPQISNTSHTDSRLKVQMYNLTPPFTQTVRVLNSQAPSGAVRQLYPSVTDRTWSTRHATTIPREKTPRPVIFSNKVIFSPRLRLYPHPPTPP